ncbi:MAG TPA: RNA methyltransferase [Vicinamibacteria bacterium]|nr:RNA methyltransferase [Vicinamibacteria bacterium]
MKSDVIRSRNNPVVRRLRELKARADADLALVEGPKLLAEAVSAGIGIVEVAAAPGMALPEMRGASVWALAPDIVASLSETETSQGVLAIVRRPSFDEEAFFRREALVLVAVGVQNPGNLGALLRTAEAAGATGAYLTDGCADPFAWKALRGSMGSAFRLPHVRRVDAFDVLDRLERRGLTVAAAVAGGTPYESVDLRGPVAILLGPEGAGLPAEVERRAAVRMGVPMHGAVESLNVGVAAGVLLFEAARQRRTAAS